jgi:diguanylate cyclase (GGDEF)-like protein
LNKVAHTQAALGKAKEALDLALISMESGFVQLDAQRKVVNWNQRFVDLHQWLAGHVVRHVPFVQLMQRTAVHLLPQANETERMQWAAQRMELLDGNHDSRQVTDPDGTIIEISERATPDGGIVIVYQDVTRLRSAMAHVELLAFYDPLTGLPNRRLLNDRLRHSLHASMRSQRHGALLFLDLDHFKTLNDTCGHVVGDELLQQVSARLKRCVREEDTVSRFGGDEFVVMLENLSADVQEATQQATAVGQDILAQMNLPYVLLNNDYRCTCSVGATLFGAEQHDAHELLQQADIAMYQVKGSGRNAMCFFDPQMLAAITSRSHLERDLRQALTAHQLVLHYQVQVANSGRPVGAEVLIRWNHPQRGLVMPSQFIALAEETGIIVSIGEWVLASACEQLQAWAHQPQFSQLQLAVNVSARQFQADNFVAVVSTLIEQYRIDAALLKLELTESLVLNNIAHTTQKMKALKQLGVRFSMDDFGTGYSSLAYLTELPLDQLKVDQSFVRNIGVKASDCAVINTIIGLGRSLSLEVIAEGVETLEQRDFLAQHGCNLCQGYLFGKPVPLANFEASFNAIFEAHVVHSMPWAAPGRDQPTLHAVA